VIVVSQNITYSFISSSKLIAKCGKISSARHPRVRNRFQPSLARSLALASSSHLSLGKFTGFGTLTRPMETNLPIFAPCAFDLLIDVQSVSLSRARSSSIPFHSRSLARSLARAFTFAFSRELSRRIAKISLIIIIIIIIIIAHAHALAHAPVLRHGVRRLNRTRRASPLDRRSRKTPRRSRSLARISSVQ